MESLSTVIKLRKDNRLLTITKSENSVDIRIAKLSREYSTNEEIEEEYIDIPMTADTYNELVSEMFKIR